MQITGRIGLRNPDPVHHWRLTVLRPGFCSDVSESFCRVKSHKLLESESSKNFSSQSRVTKTVESLPVIGLQARVTRNFMFFLRHFFL